MTDFFRAEGRSSILHNAYQTVALRSIRTMNSWPGPSEGLDYKFQIQLSEIKTKNGDGWITDAGAVRAET